MFQQLGANLRPRLQLIRTALLRRFIYPDIVAMAREYGISINDVCADVEPFELAALAAGTLLPGPDFSVLRESEFTDTEAYTEGWSSEPSVGRFLGRLAAARQGAVIVELGCFVGWTTAHLALALARQVPAGRLHYLDNEPRFLEAATANLRRLGLDGLGVPYLGMSTDPRVQQRLPAQADIVFIDTSHSYVDTLVEIDHFGARLRPRGCLVLHDSLSAPGVRRAVFERRDRFRVATFATERSNGLTILWPR